MTDFTFLRFERNSFCTASFSPFKLEICEQPGKFSNPTTVSVLFSQIWRQCDLQHMLDLSDFV